MFGFGQKVDAQQISEELKNGTALLVDVRGDDEWESGHAAGAMHLSLDRITSGEVPTKDAAKKVYLYCASGARSSLATKVLKQKGYVAENIGGLGSWRSAGGKIKTFT